MFLIFSLLAITIMSHPLTWIQAHILPQEAFSTGETIKRYKKAQKEIHLGLILPLGKELKGKSWAGFQSISENAGYLFIFRELNNILEYWMKTRLETVTKIALGLTLGEGSSFTA
jgi:hypothetical protein